MSWLDSFSALKQQETFESKLLRDRLPLVGDGHSLSPSLIERASGALAAHLPQSLVSFR